MLYCVRCKTHTDDVGKHLLHLTKNGRYRIETNCDCGASKNTFVSRDALVGAGFGDFVDKLVSYSPIELHLIMQNDHTGKIERASFAGPGTKLNKRLNPDDTWKPWSAPINAIDDGAYYHDLVYRDTEKMPLEQKRRERMKADRDLKKVSDAVIHDPSATFINRTAGRLVSAIMGKLAPEHPY